MKLVKSAMTVTQRRAGR